MLKITQVPDPHQYHYIAYELDYGPLEIARAFQVRFGRWPRFILCPLGTVITQSEEGNAWLAEHDITVAEHPTCRLMWLAGPIEEEARDANKS